MRPDGGARTSRQHYRVPCPIRPVIDSAAADRPKDVGRTFLSADRGPRRVLRIRANVWSVDRSEQYSKYVFFFFIPSYHDANRRGLRSRKSHIWWLYSLLVLDCRTEKCVCIFFCLVTFRENRSKWHYPGRFRNGDAKPFCSLMTIFWFSWKK